MDRDSVIEALRAHEPELRAAGIIRLSLFGSTARAEAGPDSDVDLLAAYDSTRRVSLLTIAGLELQLAEWLGRKVDLVEAGTLKPRIQEEVAAEAVRAF